MPIHVRAADGDVARAVLLPGNPDRAEHIAQTFFKDARRYTHYRRMDGYTGTFEGIPVSVQTTGMGCPSASIICEELSQLGARTFVRIGTCGAIQPHIGLGDFIVATAACPCNEVSEALTGVPRFAPAADFGLVRAAVDAAEKRGARVHTGVVGTMDLFYDPRTALYEALRENGVLALEMEASAVLTIASRPGHRGACLLTVSDLIETQTRAEADALQAGVDSMIAVALEAIVRSERALAG